MKTSFTLAAAAFAALALTACSRDEAPVRVAEPEYTLKVNVGIPATRAVIAPGNTDDMQAHTVQVFVYNAAGELEKTSGMKDYGTEVSLTISPGLKTVWALVNAPLESGPASLTAFPVTSTPLSANTPSSLVMSGSETVTVTGNDNITVNVRHIAAKVVLDKVTRSFTNGSYAGIPMTLKGIFMSNVVAASDYGVTGAVPSEWICKQGLLASPPVCADLLADYPLDGDLGEGKTYSVAHTFYVYPNPVEEDSDAEEWCARKTRLVLECDYNGRTCYYPVTIPGSESGAGVIQRNKVYHITGLTLTRPGSTDPDSKYPEVSSDVNCTFQITVSDWEQDYSYSESF